MLGDFGGSVHKTPPMSPFMKGFYFKNQNQRAAEGCASQHCSSSLSCWGYWEWSQGLGQALCVAITLRMVLKMVFEMLSWVLLSGLSLLRNDEVFKSTSFIFLWKQTSRYGIKVSKVGFSCNDINPTLKLMYSCSSFQSAGRSWYLYLYWCL